MPDDIETVTVTVRRKGRCEEASETRRKGELESTAGNRRDRQIGRRHCLRKERWLTIYGEGGVTVTSVSPSGKIKNLAAPRSVG